MVGVACVGGLDCVQGQLDNCELCYDRKKISKTKKKEKGEVVTVM